MIQNILIGVLAFLIALFWGHAGRDSHEDASKRRGRVVSVSEVHPRVRRRVGRVLVCARAEAWTRARRGDTRSHVRLPWLAVLHRLRQHRPRIPRSRTSAGTPLVGAPSSCISRAKPSTSSSRFLLHISPSVASCSTRSLGPPPQKAPTPGQPSSATSKRALTPRRSSIQRSPAGGRGCTPPKRSEAPLRCADVTLRAIGCGVPGSTQPEIAARCGCVP